MDPWLTGGPWRDLPRETLAALDYVLGALDGPGVVPLPTVEGVPADVVARWLYRAWREGGGEGGFGHLDTRHLARREGARLQQELARCRGGLVLLEGSHPELAELAKAAGARVLVPGGPGRPCPAATAGAIKDLDQLHAAAVDEGLSAARAVLLGLTDTREGLALAGPRAEEVVAWAGEACRGRLVAVVAPSANADAVACLQQRLTGRLPSPERGVSPAERPAGFDELVGHDPALIEALEVADGAVAAARDGAWSSVLIEGEPGVGKRLLARSMHELGGPGTWIERTPEELAEELDAVVPSELPPRFPQGACGDATVFLPRVHELSPRRQSLLAKWLLGCSGNRTWILATVDGTVEGALARGSLRDELRQVLADVAIRLPALHERPGDILPVAQALLLDIGGPGTSIAEDAAGALQGRTWPDDVRGLRRYLERAWEEAGRPAVLQRAHVRGLCPESAIVVVAGIPGLEGLPELRPPAVEQHPRDLERAVLAAVAPRPIDSGALDHLRARTPTIGWATIRPELQRIAGDKVPGPLTAPAVRRLLLRLVSAAERPLYVLVDPVVGTDDEIYAREQSYTESAVVFGRYPGAPLRSWSKAELGRFDGNVRARLLYVMETLRWQAPGVMWVGGPESFSRPHLLFERQGEAVRITRLPKAELDVAVEPLGERGHVRKLLAEGERVVVDGGAEIELGAGLAREAREARTVALRVCVCVGKEIRERLASYLLEDGQKALPPVGVTHGEPPTALVRVYQLSDGEIATLVGVLHAFLESGKLHFPAFLEGELHAIGEREPELQKYLDRGSRNHLNEASRRLVLHATNQRAADALRAVLNAFPVARVRTLPAWLRELDGR